MMVDGSVVKQQFPSFFFRNITFFVPSKKNIGRLAELQGGRVNSIVTFTPPLRSAGTCSSLHRVWSKKMPWLWNRFKILFSSWEKAPEISWQKLIIRNNSLNSVVHVFNVYQHLPVLQVLLRIFFWTNICIFGSRWLCMLSLHQK